MSGIQIYFQYYLLLIQLTRVSSLILMKYQVKYKCWLRCCWLSWQYQVWSDYWWVWSSGYIFNVDSDVVDSVNTRIKSGGTKGFPLLSAFVNNTSDNTHPPPSSSSSPSRWQWQWRWWRAQGGVFKMWISRQCSVECGSMEEEAVKWKIWREVTTAPIHCNTIRAPMKNVTRGHGLQSPSVTSVPAIVCPARLLRFESEILNSSDIHQTHLCEQLNVSKILVEDFCN